MITKKESKYILELDEVEMRQLSYLALEGAKLLGSREYMHLKVRLSIGGGPVRQLYDPLCVKEVEFYVPDFDKIPQKLIKLLYSD